MQSLCRQTVSLLDKSLPLSHYLIKSSGQYFCLFTKALLQDEPENRGKQSTFFLYFLHTHTLVITTTLLTVNIAVEQVSLH